MKEKKLYNYTNSTLAIEENGGKLIRTLTFVVNYVVGSLVDTT